MSEMILLKHGNLKNTTDVVLFIFHASLLGIKFAPQTQPVRIVTAPSTPILTYPF